MWYFGWLFITLVAFSVLGVMWSDKGHSNPFKDAVSVICGVTLFFTIIAWPTMVSWDYLYAEEHLDDYNEQSVVSDTTYIKSASLNSELHGEFVIGCGSIDSKDVYKFYKILGPESYKMMTLPVEKTRIQETDADSTFVPHVVDYYYTEGYAIHGRFYRLMLNRNRVVNYHDIHILKEHVIYVPKGTIVGDLSKLNLK